MKRAKQKSKRLTLMSLVLGTSVLLTGCGSAGSGNGVGGIGNGLYPGSPGICVPVTQQIPFTGNNIRFDSANIMANPDQIVVGGQPVPGQYVNKYFYEGTMRLNKIGTAGGYGTQPGYGYTAPAATQYANVQGYIQLTSATLEKLRYEIQIGKIRIGNYGYTNTPTPTYPGGYTGGYYPNQPTGGVMDLSQVCVSDIAINAGVYGTIIYGARVYLFLNNTNQWIEVYM